MTCRQTIEKSKIDHELGFYLREAIRDSKKHGFSSSITQSNIGICLGLMYAETQDNNVLGMACIDAIHSEIERI